MVLEQHRDRDNQTGGGTKWKTEEDIVRTKYLKGDELPETIAVKYMLPDKDEKAAKGSKVDSYFYPQTKLQQRDLKIFLNEMLSRLQRRSKLAVDGKKGVKWNLMLTFKMEMPSKYQEKKTLLSRGPLDVHKFRRLGKTDSSGIRTIGRSCRSVCTDGIRMDSKTSM